MQNACLWSHPLEPWHYQVERENSMNVSLRGEDTLTGEWEQMKSRIKQRWGRLSDDQLDRISGCGDELAGLIRKRYGYTHEKARKTIDEFIQRLGPLDQ
jgi:uncharacterized protein YjbJ (UPF0337 family)